MIIDLQNTDPVTFHADIAIVGGGMAGLLVATRLAAAKLRVAIIESGGRKANPKGDERDEVVQLGKLHSGAVSGRDRCVGGTSARWGGKMIPFLGHDLAARPHLALPSWPVSLDELLTGLPEVERLFKVDDGSYEEDPIATSVPALLGKDPNLVARYEKLPAFRRRNLGTLLDKHLRQPDVNVFINATVTEFGVHLGELRSVKAIGPGGKVLNVYARQFIISAGAIETTRLLLHMERQHRVFNGCEVLGGYFFDHLSTTVGEFQSADAKALNQMAAFRFVGSGLRGARLELSARAQIEEGAASAYGYIDFERHDDSGFEHARNLFRALQGRERLRPAMLTQLAKDAPYLIKALYWRYYHQQMLWPQAASYVLKVIAEQLPLRESRIGLADRTDRFGVPLATLNWKLSDLDRHTFRAYARRFASFWERGGAARTGRIQWRPSLADDAELDAGITDFYHPGGSTRMGHSSRSAVVDKNLRTFGIPNLWVASTSVFPSGGSANPTLMLLLMAQRLAERIISQHRSQRLIAA